MPQGMEPRMNGPETEDAVMRVADQIARAVFVGRDHYGNIRRAERVDLRGYPDASSPEISFGGKGLDVVANDIRAVLDVMIGTGVLVVTQ